MAMQSTPQCRPQNTDRALMAKPSGSASVGKQVQDRTHKGGAVLWFLRKHAPMPPPYPALAQLLDEAPAQGAKAQPQEAALATTGGEGGNTARKAAHGPQRKFL